MKTTKNPKKNNERQKNRAEEEREFQMQRSSKNSASNTVEKGMLSEGGYSNKAHYVYIYL